MEGLSSGLHPHRIGPALRLRTGGLNDVRSLPRADRGRRGVLRGDRAHAQLLRSFVRHISPSLAFLALYLGALGLQAVAGHADFNEDQDRHGDPRISLGRYLVSSEFGTAVMENWQSEYLQF